VTSKALPPAKGKGCNDPAQYPNGKLVTLSSTLGPSEFAVDYLNGLAMFGGTIQGNGDALVVRYEPIGNGISDAQPTPQGLVQGITTGTLVGGNPPNPGALQGGNRPYVYNPDETIGKFFTDNLGTNGSAPVLTGTTSDKRIVFVTNAQGVPQQPADPRYSFTTAQYYAAATYGPLQVDSISGTVPLGNSSQLHTISPSPTSKYGTSPRNGQSPLTLAAKFTLGIFRLLKPAVFTAAETALRTSGETCGSGY
jgi:hypothetical protein